MQRVFTFTYSTKPEHRACTFPNSNCFERCLRYSRGIALTTIRAIPLPPVRPFRQISGQEFRLRKRTMVRRFKVDGRVKDRGDTSKVVWIRVVDLRFQVFSMETRKNSRQSQQPVSPGISETKLDRSRGYERLRSLDVSTKTINCPV